MTTLKTAPVSSDTEIFGYARKALSGKRIALVGFPAVQAAELTRIIAEADGFTRSLSPFDVIPSAAALKPFELILLNIESAIGSRWLEPGQLADVGGRCIAVARLPALLRTATETALPFREFWAWSEVADEVLLRCVLALRSTSPLSPRTLPEGSTVVLADDDPSVTAIVRRALERNGMVCEVAAAGGEAMDLITRLKPCAAVLDVHMPHIDGFEVLSRMKNIAELAQTRVILLTGCEQESDVIRGFSLGADDYVVKPFNPMELTIRLMRVIGRI